ncbi:hypothetical protein PG991_014949 [Apiospora marii]|uniref:Uncharacterized protein n=1 Tax=Apiospora marii TaxID=335849 RepID=A0ABR1R3K2_9PEZI
MPWEAGSAEQARVRATTASEPPAEPDRRLLQHNQAAKLPRLSSSCDQASFSLYGASDECDGPKVPKILRTQDQAMIKMLSKDFDDQDRYQAIRNPLILRDDPLATDCLRFTCYFEEKDIPVTFLPTGAD